MLFTCKKFEMVRRMVPLLAPFVYGPDKSEFLYHLLSTSCIKWKFNLSQVKFERMVGLIKMTMYKIVGKSKLKRKELEKVFTDTETLLNNRLLAYIEDDVQFPV